MSVKDRILLGRFELVILTSEDGSGILFELRVPQVDAQRVHTESTWPSHGAFYRRQLGEKQFRSIQRWLARYQVSDVDFLAKVTPALCLISQPRKE